ncbi:MAG: dTMP kinase [Anaerolineae bacterium]|nr:dTMP kinase [Anaerolineae bacterium]
MLITFEGPEGSGKTTQAHLLAEYLQRQGEQVVLTREPGGTPIGDLVRDILHDPLHKDMQAWTEVMLYSASRAQLVAQVIRPALAAGKQVICDRYYDSTLAYQGYGRGLDLAALVSITQLATGGLAPDLTLCLDIAAERGLQRRLLGGGEWNRMDQEALAFHRRVRAGYLELAGLEPARWIVVDADRSAGEVQEMVRRLVAGRMQG